jgi:hypothetical protein
MKNRKLEFDAQLRPSSKKYIPKARIVSRKCKWKNKGQNDELFFTVTMSATKFIAGVNEEAPCGFIDLQCGQYNKFKINTRDFAAFVESIDQLHEFIHKHKESLDNALQDELQKYMDEQYKKLEMVKFLKNDK